MANRDNKKAESVKLGPFSKGYNNVDDEVDLPEGSARKAENVDIDRKGWFRRRSGYTAVYTGAGIHSLFDRYFVESGTLKYLEKDNTATTIVSGFTDNRLDYCYANNTLYFSNEDNNGTIDGPWGLEDPNNSPDVSANSNGGFPAGTYQISVNFVNANGEESGATNPVVLETYASGGISLTNIPQSDSGYACAVFISAADGNELFFQVMLSPGVTSYNCVNPQIQGKKLSTLFMKKVPNGQFITQYKGRMYIAENSTVWYSEAQRYGLYSPANTFFNFKERVTVMIETENGIFIVADKTYFLSGADPKQMTLAIVSKDTGIEGTGIQVDAKIFGLDFNGKVAFWYGSEGAIIGFPNGQVKYVSYDAVAPVNATSGCTGLKEINGLRQLISNLNDRSEENGFGATDNATAVVMRNGVII